MSQFVHHSMYITVKYHSLYIIVCISHSEHHSQYTTHSHTSQSLVCASQFLFHSLYMTISTSQSMHHILQFVDRIPHHRQYTSQSVPHSLYIYSVHLHVYIVTNAQYLLGEPISTGASLARA